ncbi:MAG: response regulator [Bdellovibrionaceae bacterium]|nr:response regulator [Pseudobdellovibrionaceae bacterium]
MSEIKKIRILIVDDDQEIRTTLRELIRLMGHESSAAENGREALNMVAHCDFDMILTDIQMPVMSGLELFHEVKSRNIPVVLMTGFSALVDIGKATAMGAADFLSKPFGADELKNSIRLATSVRAAAERTPEEVDAEYVRIYVPDYLNLGQKSMDIFARTPEGSFARVARADNHQSIFRLNGFIEKGLRFLYVRKEDYAEYMAFNLKLASTSPSARRPSSITEKMQFLRESIDNDMERTYSAAVPRELFEYAKSVVEGSLQLCLENDVLFQMLQSLRQQHERSFVRALGVAAYSVLGAKQVGWNGQSAAFKMALAGILHDLGKIDLPSELMRKRRADCNPEERGVYESHVVRGRDLLREMPFITEEIVQAVASHHENNSGTGYPMRLTRIRIHPLGRMLHVVDTFCDEMMADPAGSLLNPMQVFLNIYADHEEDFEVGFIRAILEIFRIPIPEKLRKVQSHLEAKAKTE